MAVTKNENDFFIIYIGLNVVTTPFIRCIILR
jgi:hypothetical protein